MGAEYRRGRGPHFSPVPFILQDDPEIDAYAVAVYAALRRFADFGKAEGAAVSDSTVAEKAGCSSRTVADRRELLARKGWLEWESGREGGTVNRYTVHATVGSASDADPPLHLAQTPSAPAAEGGSAPGADDQEPSVTENQDREITAMWEAFQEVTDSGRWQLTDVRRRRLEKVRSEIAAVEDDRDPAAVFEVAVRCLWSDPWRREGKSRYDPANVYRSAEQRERWILTALDELDAGGDGEGWHRRQDGRQAARDEEDRERSRRSAARSRELEHHRAAVEAEVTGRVERLRAWYRGLPEDERRAVKEAADDRAARWSSNGAPSEAMLQAAFVEVARERRRETEERAGDVAGRMLETVTVED